MQSLESREPIFHPTGNTPLIHQFIFPAQNEDLEWKSSISRNYMQNRYLQFRQLLVSHIACLLALSSLLESLMSSGASFHFSIIASIVPPLAS